jgi:hypothetical protein
VRAMTAALLAEMKRNDDNLTVLTVAKPAPATFDPNVPPPAIGKAKQKQKKG